MTNKQLIRKVKSEMKKKGATLKATLQELGISPSQWYSMLKQEGADAPKVPKGRRATVYTLERAREARDRVRNGEFLRDVCADMGMDPRNLARWCRVNDFKMFTKKALKENYARRSLTPRVSRKPKSSPKRDRIAEALNSGKSLNEAAKLAHASVQYAKVVRSQLRNG